MIAMLIVGLREGEPTPFDGQYLKEYDPSRDGTDAKGRRTTAHIVTTPNIHEAMKIKDLVELHSIWTKVDPREPIRYDGQPNRPLTAFTVTNVQIPDSTLN